MNPGGSSSLASRTTFAYDAGPPATSMPGGGASMAASAAFARRRYLSHLVSMEYWWSIGGFIGVLTILRIMTLVSMWIALRSSKEEKPDGREEGSRGFHSRSNSLISRMWRSANALKNIILFRLPIPLRRVHNLSNLAEVLCVGAYIGGCLAWTLMDTPNIDIPTVCPLI